MTRSIYIDTRHRDKFPADDQGWSVLNMEAEKAMQTGMQRLPDGGTLRFDRARAANPETTLMLIHGWACDRQVWTDQASHLRGRFPLLIPDLPGHGTSSAPTAADARTVSGLAGSIAALARGQGLHDLVLIGHSMGGAVALETARLLGDEAIGVIIVDTFTIDFGGLDSSTRASLYQPFADDFPGAVDWLIETLSTRNTTRDLKTRLKQTMKQADRSVALPLWQSLLAWQPEAAFRDLRCPIHAINGRLVPGTARRRCRPYLKEAVMPRAGHFLHMQDPAGFNRLLDEALARITG